jgi:thiol-disulfide isomerase/thioredoxin/uncharacterized membrane protein YphA (DoxX/SURF4 family)
MPFCEPWTPIRADIDGKVTNISPVDSFAVAVQLVLAGVFALAGAAKLRDLPGSRRAVVDFGVPPGLARVMGTLLPIAELATAVALVLNPLAEGGAIAALSLLLLFTAGISNAMIRGRAPDCNCFGQVHSAPVGPWTLMRNLVLSALAGFLVVHGPGPAIDDWVAARSAAELVAIGASVAALALAALWFRAWSENKRLRLEAVTQPLEPETLENLSRSEEPEGLPVGAIAPNFSLADMRGETRTLESLLARGRPVLLEFLDPGCHPCRLLVPALARWQSTLAERVTIAVVRSGDPDDDRLQLEEHGIDDVLLDENADVFKAFHMRSNPTAIAVDLDGTVASAPARGPHYPEVLIHQIVQRVAADEGVASPAPAATVRQPLPPIP